VTASGKPYALDYFVSPVPYDGSCPEQSTFTFGLPKNTTLLIQYPTKPPQPTLKTPPPLTPEGTPVVPVPEKSFIQKYWMYMGAVLIAILMTGGGEPEEGEGGAGQK